MAAQITQLEPPSRFKRPDIFFAEGDVFLEALVDFIIELNELIDFVNGLDRNAPNSNGTDDAEDFGFIEAGAGNIEKSFNEEERLIPEFKGNSAVFVKRVDALNESVVPLIDAINKQSENIETASQIEGSGQRQEVQKKINNITAEASSLSQSDFLFNNNYNDLFIQLNNFIIEFKEYVEEFYDPLFEDYGFISEDVDRFEDRGFIND